LYDGRVRRVFLIAAAMAAAGGAAARADDGWVVAAEVGCGYVGGVALGLTGTAVGNAVYHSEEFGSGLVGFILTYPLGVGLAAYGAGEIWGDDSRYDWATAAAAVGASYATLFIGDRTGDFKGVFIGMLVMPVAATAAYNAVKYATAEKNNGGDALEGVYVAWGMGF
jgi:hypothetical protein